MRKIIVFALMFFIGSCSYAAQYYFKPDLTAVSENAYEGAREREQKILPLQKDKIERKGSNLIIKNNCKVIQTLEDKDLESDGGALYSFVDINEKSNCLVIHIQYSQGSEYELINYKTGQATKTTGMPIWSPSSKKFLIINLDLEPDYINNIVQVWRVQDGKFIKEWELPETGSDEAEWISEEYIKIKTATFCKMPYHHLNYKTSHSKYQDGNWVYTQEELETE